MKWNVGTKLAVGFGLAVVIFVFVGTISYWSVRQLVDASNWRAHTYQVLHELEDAASALKDIETGQRGFILTGDESYLEPYHAGLKELDTSLAEVRKLTVDNAEQQRRFSVLDPLVASRVASAQEVLNTRRTGTLEAALEILKTGRGKSLMDQVRKVFQEMQDEEEMLLTKRTKATDELIASTQIIVVGGTIVALLVAGLAGWLITRSIAKPLQDLTVVAERITAGDLTADVSVAHSGDEVGVLARMFEKMGEFLRGMAGTAERIAAGDLRVSVQPLSSKDVLGNSFAKMTDTLRDQIRGLVEGANVLGSAASEIVASTAQLASGAAESATAVSETTTTVEEVRQTAQMSSQKAKAVSEAAQSAAQVAQSGRRAALDAVAGTTRIRQQMEAIAGSMVRLSEQGQAIGQIIATVEDLAAQSNLLAVNAAIEAAKAGEYGRGFGVVAQEVKTLAEQSRQATNQVRSILGEIQKATAAAVMATEQGTKAVESGSKQTESAGDSIQALTGNVSEAAQAALQIAASSQQQLVGMEQVTLAMENIKQASTQNMAGARQLESAARNLNDVGQRLRQMVDRYKV